MERILLIVNADAGGDDGSAMADVVARLRAHADVRLTESRGSGDLEAALTDRDGRVVVVAGGDGTLHAVVRALHRRGELAEVVVGLVPVGTGNDFARGMSIPLEPAEAAQLCLSGSPRPVDLLVDDEADVVVNAVHIGVGAEAGAAARPWKRRFGKLGYLVGAVVAGARTQGQRFRVVADGDVLADGRRRVLQIGVANGRYVGGGTELAPGADPTDGLADVLVSFAVGRVDRLLYGARLKRGTHAERHDVHTVRATRVTVSGPDFRCNADGELVGPYRQRTWTLLPGALTLLLPPRLPRRMG